MNFESLHCKKFLVGLHISADLKNQLGHRAGNAIDYLNFENVFPMKI